MAARTACLACFADGRSGADAFSLQPVLALASRTVQLLRTKMPRLLRLRSAWGLSHLASGNRRPVFATLRDAGWDGVEASLDDLGTSAAERRDAVAAARAEDMSLIISAYSSWKNYDGPHESVSVAQHADAMARELAEIAELHAGEGAVSPILRVNAHSGTDAWSEAEAIDYFEATLGASRALGAALPETSHETHRGRYLCCPFATARLLARVPAVRLTSDLSHWVVKCERLLDTPDEAAFLAEAIAPAVDHLHARCGTPQAPQVASVHARGVQRAVARHHDWWATVWSVREAASISGRGARLTATIEYGPVERAADDGEYVGYTPADLDAAPVAGVGLDETLAEARDALTRRFEAWHGEEAARRRGGW